MRVHQEKRCQSPSVNQTAVGRLPTAIGQPKTLPLANDGRHRWDINCRQLHTHDRWQPRQCVRGLCINIRANKIQQEHCRRRYSSRANTAVFGCPEAFFIPPRADATQAWASSRTASIPGCAYLSLPPPPPYCQHDLKNGRISCHQAALHVLIFVSLHEITDEKDTRVTGMTRNEAK